MACQTLLGGGLWELWWRVWRGLHRLSLGLLGLHARQATNYGVLGTVGFLAALVGTALVLANVLLIRTAERSLLDLLLLLGLLGVLFGFVLMSIATLRARV